MPWALWEYKFALASSLQRNEPEREATLAAASGESTASASGGRECDSSEWECWSPISEPDGDVESSGIEFSKKLVVAVSPGAV